MLPYRGCAGCAEEQVPRMRAWAQELQDDPTPSSATESAEADPAAPPPTEEAGPSEEAGPLPNEAVWLANSEAEAKERGRPQQRTHSDRWPRTSSRGPRATSEPLRGQRANPIFTAHPPAAAPAADYPAAGALDDLMGAPPAAAPAADDPAAGALDDIMGAPPAAAPAANDPAASALRVRQILLANALSAIGLGQLIAGQREGEDLVVGRVCTAWATRRLLGMGTAQIQVEKKGRTPTGPLPKLKLGMKKASLRLSIQRARLLAARAS